MTKDSGLQPGGTIGGWIVGVGVVSLSLVCGLVLWQPKNSVLVPSLIIIGAAAALILWQQISQTLLQLARNGAQLAREHSDANGTAVDAGAPADHAAKAGGFPGESTSVIAASARRQIASVADVTRRVQGLSSRCEEIGQVVEVLDDLARQTNVLALNAALEASRAGSQGHGFAMVAEEVHKLAERSANATRDVGAFIQSIEASSAEAVRLLEEVGELSRSIAANATRTGETSDEMIRSSSDSLTIATPLGIAVAGGAEKENDDSQSPSGQP